MKFEQFKKVLDTIRDFDKTITAIEGLNIGMIDSNICTDFWTLQESFFSEVYTQEAYEWISYYLYEIPLLEEKAKKNGESTNDGWAKDENGNIKPVLKSWIIEHQTEIVNVRVSGDSIYAVERKKKIDDFGEKIGGAKKDLMGKKRISLEDLKGMSVQEKDKYLA